MKPITTFQSPRNQGGAGTRAYSFLWTVDGEVYTGAVLTTVHTGDTVAASEAVSRQVWGCTVTPNDGEADGPSATSDGAIIVWSCYELACADAKWTGENSGDRLGAVSAVGDVYADGFEDVLIGVNGVVNILVGDA